MLAGTLCFVMLPKSTTWLALKSNKHAKCYVRSQTMVFSRLGGNFLGVVDSMKETQSMADFAKQVAKFGESVMKHERNYTWRCMDVCFDDLLAPRQAWAVERAKGTVGRLAVQAKRPRLQVQKAKRQQARQVDAPTMDDFDRAGLARQVAVPTQEGLGQAKQKPNLGDQPRQAPFQNAVL